jgi:outer membrane protein insertion porin family
MKARAFIFGILGGICLEGRSANVMIDSRGLQVRIDGVGEDTMSDVKALIEDQITLTNDNTVSPPLADDLSFFLRILYRELGYREVEVNWKAGNGLAVLQVNEGERYSVGEVSYLGNNSQTESELTEYLLRPTHERVGNSAKTPFVYADLQEGAELVQRYYHAQGFLDAVVASPIYNDQPQSHKMDVRLKIQEGQRYVFGKVSATGAPGKSEREIEKLLHELPGQPFNEVKVETQRKNIIGVLQQRGHYAPTVITDATRTPGTNGVVPVVFRITPGPIFRISEVDIAPGLSKGAERIIRSGFSRASGKAYSPSELEFLTRKSLDSGIFSRLDVKPIPSADNNLKLDVSGEEAPRTTLSASLGYETFLGPFARAEARQVNVMDTGDSASVRAEYTTRGTNIGIKWLDPAILESAYSLDAELGAQSLFFFDYERRTLSLRTSLKKRWNKQISTDAFVETSINDSRSDALTPDELGPAEYGLGVIGTRITLDYRDSPVLPMRGWVSSLGIASASGDTSYLRSDASIAFSQRISKKYRGAIGFKSSALHMTDDPENVPIDLRVFNGGATSVRSFPEREMGPRSRKGDTPLGGLMSQAASIEISYDLRPNLELALFGDAGNLSDTVDNPFSPPAGVRYAIGLGLRYRLPIGPLRLDYGINPDRQAGEPFGAVHLAFGFAF